jgi:hypothetical protein
MKPEVSTQTDQTDELPNLDQQIAQLASLDHTHFPAELLAACAFRPGQETAAEFRKRIEDFFPQTNQRILVETLWKLAQIGSNEILANTILYLSSPFRIPEQIERVFPPQLNQSMKTFLQTKDYKNMQLQAAPEVAKEIVDTCKVAINFLQNHQEAQVREIRRSWIQFLLGEEKAFSSLSLTHKILVLRNKINLLLIQLKHGQAGREVALQEFETSIRNEITVGNQNLLITKAIEGLIYIRDHVEQPFDPIDMVAYALLVSFGLQNFQMPLRLGKEIFTAVQDEMGLLRSSK